MQLKWRIGGNLPCSIGREFLKEEDHT